MPSEAAKKRQAQKKEKRQAASRAAQKRQAPLQQTEKENGEKGQLCCSSSSSLSEGACAAPPSLKEVDGAVADLKLSARSCTGKLFMIPHGGTRSYERTPCSRDGVAVHFSIVYR